MTKKYILYLDRSFSGARLYLNLIRASEKKIFLDLITEHYTVALQ